MLRFITAGSVDDGKSTLIGRLLYDSKSLFEDQLAHIESASKRSGNGNINLALLTDGLKAEREQGITIDVAYRYFSTAKRKFIIADTPGHVQYTRNMITGASMAQLALILVDARKGLVEQTRRHSFIASLLGLNSIVVCINKMDLVGFDQKVYEQIKSDYTAFAKTLRCKNIYFIPISALLGDNIVTKSENMRWYNEGSLLALLETVDVDNDLSTKPSRFGVQNTVRAANDYRGYAGMVWSGSFKVGDKVTVEPHAIQTEIASIDTMNGTLEQATAMQSVCIRLKDEIDAGRGSTLVKTSELPTVSNEIDLTCCWLSEKPMQDNARFILRAGLAECRCAVTEISSRVDINTMQEAPVTDAVKTNDIVRLRIHASAPVVFDNYYDNRFTGSMILIDETTNDTVAAGIVA